MEKSVNFIKKNFLLLVAVVCLSGCASIPIPQYIKDDNPYKHKVYAPFDQVSSTAKDVLDKTGWKILSTTDPSVFERAKDISDQSYQQVLLISDIRQTAFFIGSRYARINMYIRSSDPNVTELEIRYVTVSSMLFKSFYKYRNDPEANRIFKHIEEELNTTAPASK